MFPKEILKEILFYADIYTIINYCKTSRNTLDKHFFYMIFQRDNIKMKGENYDDWIRYYILIKYKYTDLPLKYRGIIKEQKTNDVFWGVDKCRTITYKNTIVTKYDNIDKPIKNLKIGDKGFKCINCNPGSGPQPFIVVDVDHETGQFSVIYPYVYIINTDDHVNLLVGSDILDREKEYNDNKSKFLKQGTRYNVCHYNMNCIPWYISMCVGTFGNGSLPFMAEGDHEFLKC